jgi:hypothetical protein
MKLVEPTTMLTDYLLGLVYLCLGVRLFRTYGLIMAGLAFFTIAAAAFTGGSYHGLAAVLRESTLSTLWNVSLALVGFSSFFLLAAVLSIAVKGTTRGVWFSIAALQLCGYLFWIAVGHREFRFAIYDYASAMAAILGFSVVAARRGNRAFGQWMAGGIATCLLASVVQASHFALHRNFNHNDLYHVIQIGGAVLFYRAFVQASAHSIKSARDTTRLSG